VSYDSPFNTTVFNDSTLTDTLAIVGPLQYLTRYYWRVQSINAKGTSTYSSVWSFTTVIESPPVPQLTWPASASSNLPISLTLRWNSSVRTDRYHLQVATDAPFSSTVVDDSTLVDTVKTIGPLENSKTYYWRVSAKNAGWVTPYSAVWSMTTMAPPKVFALYQNYPNPFNPTTTIVYELPYETVVSLKIYDMLGQLVDNTVDAKLQKSGRYTVEFDGRHLASGSYIYKLTAAGSKFVKKFMILR
jgi:hypothetical protein